MEVASASPNEPSAQEFIQRSKRAKLRRQATAEDELKQDIEKLKLDAPTTSSSCGECSKDDGQATQTELCHQVVKITRMTFSFYL